MNVTGHADKADRETWAAYLAHMRECFKGHPHEDRALAYFARVHLHVLPPGELEDGQAYRSADCTVCTSAGLQALYAAALADATPPPGCSRPGCAACAAYTQQEASH